MTRTTARGGMLALGLLVLVSGCATKGGPPRGAPSSAPLPADSGALVVQISRTGGFMGPAWWAAQLPVVSVYADGRVISQGPVPAIHPGPALPNLVVQHLDRDQVQQLADAALAAGVADTSDLGEPRIADATTTRFTLVTAAGTYQRDAYALGEGAASDTGDGLTEEQLAARAKLQDLYGRVTDVALGSGQDEPYRAGAVAVLARPWNDPEDGLEHPPVAWPGPALPGEPMSTRPDTGCTVATGDEGQAVLEAAGSANALTPWVGADGGRWSVVFRPLLPHESSCADLDT